jgi:uncharacterized protein YcbK (DUF882 family)
MIPGGLEGYAKMLKLKKPGLRPASLDRRHFLRQTGLACGVFGALAALPSFALGSPRPRSLRFVHTHTGETLNTTYFNGSDYDAPALLKVDHLLRDFRTGDSKQMDPALLDVLWALQSFADRDATFEIISGYRSPATNAMLHQHSSGVAEHSQHILGKAIDVRLTGYSTRRLSEHARRLARGGVGFYAASDFVHVDTGRVRFW